MAKSNYHSGEKREECYFCGCGPPLSEHHVIPQRFGGPDSKENIVEVCDLCHRKVERLYDKSFYEWFGIEDEKGKRKFHRSCEVNNCTNKATVEVDWYSKIHISSEIPFAACLEMSGPKEGLYCRPCLAKYCSEVAKRWQRIAFLIVCKQDQDYIRRYENDLEIMTNPLSGEEIMDKVTVESESLYED